MANTLSRVRAVVLHAKGGPDVLSLEEVPDPKPAPDEALIRVEAAGVNHIDLTWRAGGGIELPAILGLDAGGRRERTGERVLVTGSRGTYAELVAAKEDNVFDIPDELETTTAAALGVPYKTAWWSLVEMGGLKEGHTVLVQGAASATGQACIEIARAAGAKVYATTRKEKLEQVQELGVEALEYGDASLRNLKANIVYDPVGAETFTDSVEALGREGVVVTPGAVGGAVVTFNVWSLLGKRARIQGVGSAQASRQTMEVLIGMAAGGKIRPAIDRVLPLEQAADAHRAIEARETFGKVLLRP
jgi:NADPH:quinone reductase-like Zn-dependent oxidoreductase